MRKCTIMTRVGDLAVASFDYNEPRWKKKQGGENRKRRGHEGKNVPRDCLENNAIQCISPTSKEDAMDKPSGRAVSFATARGSRPKPISGAIALTRIIFSKNGLVIGLLCGFDTRCVIELSFASLEAPN